VPEVFVYAFKQLIETSLEAAALAADTRSGNKLKTACSYLSRLIPGLLTIFTSKSLKKEMISKIKKAIKKNNRTNKPRRMINA